MDYQKSLRYKEAVMHDFTSAMRKARRSRLIARIRRTSDNLVSLETVRSRLKPAGESYTGCKSIRVNKIVGSEGRSSDFNKDFLPRKSFMQMRWSAIAAAFLDDKTIPPIQVLEINGQYFVRDGKHRVSVARIQRREFIDAEIITLRTRKASEQELVAG